MATVSDQCEVDVSSSSALVTAKCGDCDAEPCQRTPRPAGDEDRGSGRANIRRSREVPHVGGADADDVEHMRVAVALARDVDGVNAAVDLAEERRAADGHEVEGDRAGRAGEARGPHGHCCSERLREPDEADCRQSDEGGLPERRALMGRVVLDDRYTVAGGGPGVDRVGDERQDREYRPRMRLRQAAAAPVSECRSCRVERRGGPWSRPPAFP